MAIKNAPDLTQRPPRSPRVRLGGYVILPRMLDKGRATVAGKHGEYHYACPSTTVSWTSSASNLTRSRSSLPPARATPRSCNGFRRTRSASSRSRKSWHGRPTRNSGRPRIPSPASSSTECTARSLPNARTSPPGSTCSTWTTTSRSAARPEVARRLGGVQRYAAL